MTRCRTAETPADLKDPEGHRAEVITCITFYYINYSPYEVVVVVVVTWLTEVMACDTSYQLSVLRSFPVHLTSGDPEWSGKLGGRASSHQWFHSALSRLP